jgi:hypothetical protein
MMKSVIKGTLVATVILAIALMTAVIKPQTASAALVSYNGDVTWETGNVTNGADQYLIQMEAGQVVVLTMLCTGADFDPYLEVQVATGTIASNDDGYAAPAAENPCGGSAVLSFTAPAAGSYEVNATSYDFASGVDYGTGTGTYQIVADGEFIAFGPNATDVPHFGTVQIQAGQAEAVFFAPGSTQAITGSDGAVISLPADSDSSGYDTYTVAGAALVDGELWIALWLGGPNYGWIPLDNTIQVSQLVFPQAILDQLADELDNQSVTDDDTNDGFFDNLLDVVQ